MRTTTVRAAFAAAIAAMLLGGPTATDAQGFSWPERAENLQQLPADFPPERLRAVMQGFTNALGVRCSYCHVGEEGQPLSAYDFASDDNPHKVTARAMLRLLGTVNDHLDEIEPSGEEVNMWCHTCHNGKPRPQTLIEAVQERYNAEGADAAFAYFRELREEYYGGPSYDFRPRYIVEMASAAMEQMADTALATRFIEANLEDYPDSPLSHEGMGDLQRILENSDEAIRHYEHALELNPGDRRLERKLEMARGR